MKLRLVLLILLLLLLSACQKQHLELADIEPNQDAPNYDYEVKLTP